MTNFGTDPVLTYMSKSQPDLIQALTSEIVDDLEFNYTYTADAFPGRPELESSYQRKERLEMIEEWMNIHNWQANKKEKAYILTTLFYSIWNQRYALQSTPKQTLLPSRLNLEEKVFTHRTPQSKAFELEKHSTQSRAQPSKFLGNIDHRGILKHMLDKVMELHAPRYADFLNTRDDWETLLPRYLRGELWEVCKREEISLSDLLSIGGEIDYPAPGIYMHILWDPAEELASSTYLYVGQSENIQDRIRRHNDPWNRARHPSLHYHVWDSNPRMNSAFVILGNTGNPPQLQLNLLESWCSLIFQTLQIRDLRTYLPQGTAQLGCHLNVAHPLWQSSTSSKQDHYEGKESFRELILTSDPMIAGYYRSLAQAFHELKDSSNPLLRAYWLAARHRSQVCSSAAKMEQTLSKLLGGTLKAVRADKKSHQTITFGYVNFRIRKQELVLENSSYIHAQGFLTDGSNTERYALDALPEDPAIRFSLKITGIDIFGKSFRRYISSKGETTVKDINTLVDRLCGVKVADIAKTPRRMVPPDISAERYERTYT